MKKDLTVALAFLAGASLASALILLFTTEKGEELRHKVAAWLKEKGIELKAADFDQLINQILSFRNSNKQPFAPHESELE